MEYLTTDNIQYFFIVVTWMVYIARKIIWWTPTKSDDEALKAVDAACAMVSSGWEVAYKEVEEISKVSRLTSVQKTFQYMKLINDAWVKAQGKQIALPKVAEIIANANAKTQALKDKLNLLKDVVEAKWNGTISPNDVAVEEKK